MEQQALQQIKKYFYNLLPTMDDEKWAAFAAVIKIRQYKKGDMLLKPGKVCNDVSFINKGLLRTFHVMDEKEIIHSFFAEECYYSDYESFLSRTPTYMFTEALEDTETADIHYDDLQNLYARYADCERAGRLIAEGLFMLLSARNSSFLLQTPEQRYRQFYMDSENIANRIPLYMVASYLGITPEALSRIRARYKQKAA